MTIDYRRANLLIRSDQYPLPLAERLIRHVSQYKYYIQLDLGEGYYNIKCTDTLTRKLLAFKTGDGKLYYWNVMPQGSKNAPAIFQAAMEKILAHHIDQGTARVYLDDLVLCSHTIDDLLHTFDDVLTLFGSRGMRFKFSKSNVLVTRITILGRIVSNGQISIDQTKLSGIHNFGTPTTNTDVRSFCGILNWIKPHIPNLATILAPLYALTGDTPGDTPLPTPKGKTRKIHWTPEAETAFQAAKQCVSAAHTLHLFNPSWETVSTHDASTIGAGALLLQRPSRIEPWQLVYCWRHSWNCIR